MTWSNVTLREMEAFSIREFVTDAAEWMNGGRVLDFGAGKTPYRSIVEKAGSEYVPFDRRVFPASVATTDVGPEYPLQMPEAWDAILCTQVLQYIPNPTILIDQFHEALKYGGHLVMTGPTTWPVIEPQDLWRFTPAGVERLLSDFSIQYLEPRGEFEINGFRLALGWGVVATR